MIDATEGIPLPDGNFRRAWLPSAAVRVVMADGRVLPGVHAYVNSHGVLRNGEDVPRGHPGQRPLLEELLENAQLRELFGDTPRQFTDRARTDAELCARGTRLFRELG